jgi:predicted ATP-grasp superfamily ATP-dependent carboligase
VRALILDARNARASLAAARALAADGWTVGIGAPRPDGLAAASRRSSAFHPVPRPEDGAEAFAAALGDAVRAGGYDVVFASSDVDVLALSAARDAIAAAVPYPPHAVLRRALDKLQLTRAAERAGLRVPRTAEDPADLPATPVVVKERIHGDLAAGGPARTTGTDIAGDRDAARAGLAALATGGGAGFVQEIVRGRLVALTVLCDRGPRLVARVQQEALRVWPGDAGTSARARTVRIDEELAAGVERLLSDLGWFGLAQLQFLATPGETPRLIDLNPRFYGSLALAVAAGVNLPALWARLATGRAVPARSDAAAGVRYQWLEADLRRARERRGTVGVTVDALGCLRWSIGARHSIWARDDPRPFARAAAALVRERLP